MHHFSRKLRIFLMFSSIVQIVTLLLGLSAALSAEQPTRPIVWTDASASRRLLPPRFPNWHLNDHAIFRADDGTWHLFSIAAKNPDADRSESRSMSDREKAVSLEAQRHHPFLDHAYSRSLTGGWTYSGGENWYTSESLFHDASPPGQQYLMWAPHVVKTAQQIISGNSAPLYHMFYAGGGSDVAHFEIVHRTSSDLQHWSPRADAFPPGQDGIQARDPMVLYLSDSKLWAIYYTGTDALPRGHHVVFCRTSPNLADGSWSAPQIAYQDTHIGRGFGPTESPFVLKRGAYFYLFIGPRPYDPPGALPNWRHPGYVGTDVFRSKDWRHWADSDFVGHLPVHAAEVIQDLDGKLYVSSAGIEQGGLYLLPLFFDDGQ